MAAKFRDYYTLLGVDRNATDKEIKSAYRKLAREYHPDLHSDSSKKEAEERFKEINEAYEVLGDPEKRSKYDNLGANWNHGQEWQPAQNTDGFHFYTSSNDMGGYGSSGFSDFFESLFGGGFHFNQAGTGFADEIRHTRNARGQDIESELEITLEEAYQGIEKVIQFTSRDSQLNVKIPAGIQEGTKMRLKGQGSKGYNGTDRGDLFLKINFKPHKSFTVSNNDIETQIQITPEQAVLGDKVSVPTLDGEVLLSVPPLTHNDQKLRLRQKGWPRKDGSRGDEYVKIVIDIPKDLSPEEMELYKKLAELKKDNNVKGS
ncbi:MAG: molecular chaperone DnaJ [Firmicutes bacterium HGW-Firmicutes-12]|nr:MAG: molecular chaperone DnaJ [Firmicutes bacterium HGW-Firmicutes-12]